MSLIAIDVPASGIVAFLGSFIIRRYPLDHVGYDWRSMPLQPGTRLGPYEIVASLGAGGMGEVYKAADTRLNRTVAIKVLPLQFSEDPERRHRFEREARAIAALNHPHICTLYDVGRQEDIEFLVMEYLEGRRSPIGFAVVRCRSTRP